MAKTSASETITIDGHLIKITNLDKVLYPETGTTKRDVMAYYDAVAELIIPQVANRPATRKRWVNGVGTEEKPGQVFFQKNLDSSTPEWVQRFPIEHREHSNDYPMVNNRATLIWLAQIASLEIHVPQWQFGPRGAIRDPDRLVLDLDPGPGIGLPECAEVARFAREILSGMELEPIPVTSGSKGIHLYAGLAGDRPAAQISQLARELARALEAEHPDLVISTMKRSDRAGKVFIDWSQNNGNKTTVAPYSLRGRLRPTVAVPRSWEELDDADLRHLEYDEVLQRIDDTADPIASLGRLPHGDQDRDRLTLYRSKRDADKTPEPVPEAASRGGSDGRSFVIQEHHARALHWDFRLEHDGVLVSWALPKGPPTDPKKNHLAVQTEDHPLEYATFSGDIPKGEYGGGKVAIWDTGTFELEKWRDGKEVIATLHGAEGGGLGGSAKFALIHTGRGDDTKTWLIHRMALDPSAATSSPAPMDVPDPEELPEPDRTYAPMLATLGTEHDVTGSEDDWAFEMKWDGVRALAYVDGSAARFVSRNDLDLTVSYPELQSLAGALDRPAVVDGEIVALKDGRPDFSQLQTRMKLTRPDDVRRAMRSAPVQFLLFDVLAVDGQSMINKPWRDRREALDSLVLDQPAGSPIQLPPVFDGDLEAAMSTSKELRLEGVLAKTRSGRYQQGRRSRTWIKIKHHLTQEVVVGGWKPGQGRRADQIGSLLLGVPEEGSLRFVGRVGTGFSDRDLDEIRTTMNRLSRKTSPFGDLPRADAKDARWVTPSQVGEVEFTEWTGSGRLRHPAWRGWRPDKDAEDVVVE